MSGTFLKILLIFLLSGSAVFLIYAQTSRWLRESSFFRIREVVLAPSLKFIDPAYLLRLKGKSMFSVDLETIHRQLRGRYPEVDALRIVRKFPDRIYIAANKREPVACVVLGRHQFLVDREGVVVAPGPAVGMKLPTIQGLHRGKHISFGESLNLAEVDAALEVIHAFQSNTDLKAYAIQRVDVGNLAKISFYLNSNNLEVIIDPEAVEQKIARLGIVLTEGKPSLAQISYIDLRFQQPILGKKNLDADIK